MAGCCVGAPLLHEGDCGEDACVARIGIEMARKQTRIVQAGRDPALHAGAVNVPVYRASTILFPDVETMRTEAAPYSYGRRGTPTTRSLEHAIGEREGGARTVLTPSVLSAFTLFIL